MLSRAGTGLQLERARLSSSPGLALPGFFHSHSIVLGACLPLQHFQCLYIQKLYLFSNGNVECNEYNA